MKTMRGKFVRKLKLFPTNLKQGLVLHLNQQDILCIQKCPTPPPFHNHKANNFAELEVTLDEIEDVGKHFEEEEDDDKAKPTKGSNTKETELAQENYKMEKINTNELPSPSLTDFEEKCPPGGSNKIILYTTSMRGIRKTFQDCNTIRFLLNSFKIVYLERDVSLHLEYREELWKLLGEKVIPPRLFIKGRFIGGADEVVGLHEMGWLGKFLEGTPRNSVVSTCIGCGDLRFAICNNCCGSCKVFAGNNGDNNDGLFIRCPECNENGLVKCSICC